MATSGSFTFRLTIDDIITEGYERAGRDAQILTGYDVTKAIRSLNIMFSDWSTRGVNYWTTEFNTLTLTQGTALYSLPVGTIDVLSAIVRRSGTDTVMNRISLTDYSALPDKTTQGKPSSYFFDRQYTPQVYFWQVPENSTDTIEYWMIRQVEDITTMNEDADVPRRWTEAMVSGLAYRLATKAPDLDTNRITLLESQETKAFEHAATDEDERATLSIRTPSVI